MKSLCPSVFAVGDEYQIMLPVAKESFMWVEIGDEKFYDESNGVMRSRCTVHRVSVPMEVLDKAKQYTVCEKVIIDRKPYFPLSKPTRRKTYNFFPVESLPAKFYQIADAHNMEKEPIAAAKAFGDIDFLVMNGDIPNHSGTPENFTSIYRIASGITGGERPIVFARGNHDLRGNFAESIADYIPTKYGNTYYTTRLGPLWFLVLDCGEDKTDDHKEYGHSVACRPFRLRQTKFIESIVKNAKTEYKADGIEKRFVVVHNPFTRKLWDPFFIEEDIYSEWSRLLREKVKPDIMLCGHVHTNTIYEIGSEYDYHGQACPVACGGVPEKDKKKFSGMGGIVTKDGIEIVYTSNK